MIKQSRAFKTAVLTIGKTAALASSLAMAAVLSRILSKADYGAFSQIITIYAICNIAFQVGIPQSIYYYMPRLVNKERRGFALQSALLMAGQGAVASAMMFFGADFLGSLWNSPQLPGLLKVFSLYPLFMLPVMAMENVLIVEEHPIFVVVFNVISKFIAFLAVVLPIVFKLSIQIAIRLWIIVAFAEFAVAIIIILIVVRGDGISFRIKYIKDQYRFSLPFGIAAILGALGYYIDKITVNYFGNPELYAVYINGAIELPILGMVAIAVTMSISPSMVQFVRENRKDELLQLWHRSQVKVSIIVFGLLGWLMFYAPELIQIIFSNKYSTGIILFRIYLLLVPCRIISFQSIMVPLGLNWKYAKGHLFYLLLAIVICPLLYWKYGMIGVSIGAVIAFYFNIVLAGYFTSRALGIKILRVWALRQLAFNLLFALFVGLVSWGALIWIPDNTYLFKALRLVAGGIIFFLAYYYFGLRIGIIKKEDMKSIFPRRVIKENFEIAPDL